VVYWPGHPGQVLIVLKKRPRDHAQVPALNERFEKGGSTDPGPPEGEDEADTDSISNE